MPAAIPLIAAVAGAAASAVAAGAATAAALTVFGLSVATTAALIGGLAGAVVAFAVGAIGNALMPQNKGRAADPIAGAFARTQQVRQPITAHRIVVGRARVSGPIVFLHTNASARTAYQSRVNGSVAADYAAEELLYLVHVLCGVRIDGVETVLFDNTPATDDKYSGNAYVISRLGATNSAAPPLLLDETDGVWTADHRLRGRAYIASVLRYDPAVFPSGVPNVSAIVRGVRTIYDPRTGATTWSNNAALIVAWYLTWESGLRADWDDIDQPSLIEAANICDEQVSLSDGSTEPRYTCSGTFDLDETPRAILERLVGSMGGAAVFSGGRWFIRAGAWSEPAMTVTQDMLRGPVTVRANRSARDLWNGVRAVYIRPAAGWQPTDAPPLQDAEALAADGGVERWGDLQLDCTVSGYRAQRLMQMALRRNRLARSVQVPLNLSGLNVRCMDRVRLSLPRLPEDTYLVTRWALSAEGGVDLVLEQDAESVYAWNPETDEQPLGDVGEVAFPSGAALDAPAITVTTPSSAVPSSIAIAWGAISGAGSYEAQASDPDTTAWTDLTPSGTSATATASAGRLAFRVRARAGDDYSLWTNSQMPAAPTAVTVVGTAGGFDVTMTLAAGMAKAQIFIGTTGTYASATKHSVDPTSSGTTSVADLSGVEKYVWLRSVAADGNFGAPTAPLRVTPGDTGTGGWIEGDAGASGADSGADGGGTGDSGGGDE